MERGAGRAGSLSLLQPQQAPEQTIPGQLELIGIRATTTGRGTVSVVGAHFNPAAPVDLGRMFANETTNLIHAGGVGPRRIISHRLPLGHAAQTYEIFRAHGATKVLLAPGAA